MEKDFRFLRTVAFGGFNKKDVVSYVEKIQNEYFEYKKQVEATVDGLNRKIRELENAAGLAERAAFLAQRAAEEPKQPEQESAQSAVEATVVDIGQATVQLKSVVDELCRNLGEFMDKLNRNALTEELSEAEVPQQAEAEPEQPMSVADMVMSKIMSLGQDGPAERETEPDKRDIAEILSDCPFIQ